jgi:hypothetical protein
MNESDPKIVADSAKADVISKSSIHGQFPVAAPRGGRLKGEIAPT